MSWLDRLLGRGPTEDPHAVWARLRPEVEHLARPAIGLRRTARPTSSWLGGAPVVDGPRFRWPESPDGPMAFLGQLDLRALAAAHRFEWLPGDGALAFFYDVEAMPWGFDPADRGRWAVRHLASPAVEASRPADLDDDHVFEKAFLAAATLASFPDLQDEAAAGLELTDAESDAYCDLSPGDEPGTPLHQVGGFARPVQSHEMALECQLAANGIYVGDDRGYLTDAATRLATGARDWRLLLQLDSDEEVGFMWGDLGMLYFWIREQDARAMRFGKAWLVLQCT